MATQQTYDKNYSQEQRQTPTRYKPTAEELDAWSQFTQAKFSPAEVELIFTDCPAETSVADFKKFLYNCAQLELNPLLNEAHLEYRKDGDGGRKVAIVTHIDAYRRRAAEKDLLDGMKQTIGYEGGTAIENLYVTTIAYKKGCLHPFEATVFYREFAGRKFDQTPTYIWKTKPIAMTAKCSAALCYRVMGVLSGTITDDELSAERNTDAPPTVVTHPNVTQVGQFGVGKKEETTVPPPAAPAPEPLPAAAPPAPAIGQAPPAAPSPEVPPAEQTKKLKADVIAKVPGLKGADFKRYMLGWFHVAVDKDLPAAAEAYLAPLQALMAFVEQGSEFAMQMADVKNQTLLGAKLTTIPAPAKPSTIDSRVASLQKLGWSEQAAAIGARVMATRELTEGDLLAYLKQVQVDPSNDSEVQALLSICLYTRDAFRIAAEARKSNTTIAAWAEFIEKTTGTRLLDKECDPDRVQKCIDDALKTAAAEGAA
jgi:hypothetical protein